MPKSPIQPNTTPSIDDIDMGEPLTSPLLSEYEVFKEMWWREFQRLIRTITDEFLMSRVPK